MARMSGNRNIQDAIFQIYGNRSMDGSKLFKISLEGKGMRGSRSQDQKGRLVLSLFTRDNLEVLEEITIPEAQPLRISLYEKWKGLAVLAA